MEPVIIGVDPGESHSGVVIFGADTQTVIAADAHMENHEVLKLLSQNDTIAVVENIENFGMPAGKSLFETSYWIGRMTQAHGEDRTVRVGRRVIKLHFCGSARATDANIRAALIDRFGPPGTKRSQGKLYNVKSHGYSALALAVYYFDCVNANVQR
jgi:hypothetical protein